MPTIAVEQISVGPNRRSVKDEKVAELMESIKANGLLNPITIDQNFNLVAGLHRLTACKLIGITQIECTIITCEDATHSRLAEIDENLIRSELNALERSELWLERDRILDKMGLRAKPGQNQHRSRGGETVSPLLKTTLELAKETGYTDRTFQHGKQIARSIVPEVKEILRTTELAHSPTALLKVARAGSQERQQAEQAEQAAQMARAQQHPAESDRLAAIAAEARAKQKELQIVALYAIAAEKEAKSVTKKSQRLSSSGVSTITPKVQTGDEWNLDRHFVYCGDTTSSQFVECLPSNAALAIATLSSDWNHDYLVNEAKVVVVLRSEGSIHDLCHQHQMPFQFEWMLGDIYAAVFSRQMIPKPQAAITVRGVEGIVAYLISAYAQPGNFVIAPFMGHGEVLMACEKMGRICFVGDQEPARVERAIADWQTFTAKQATFGGRDEG
jgi:ParB family transcriptional regulator, chromosome partitioning protein